jgi:hypothetical protein
MASTKKKRTSKRGAYSKAHAHIHEAAIQHAAEHAGPSPVFDAPIAAAEPPMCNLCCGFQDEPCTLACGHTSCLTCTLKWFKKKQSCPVCRRAQKDTPSINIDMQRDAKKNFPMQFDEAQKTRPRRRNAVVTAPIPTPTLACLCFCHPEYGFCILRPISRVKAARRELALAFGLPLLLLGICYTWSLLIPGESIHGASVQERIPIVLNQWMGCVQPMTESDLVYTLLFFHLAPLAGILLNGHVRAFLCNVIWPANTGLALLPTIWSALGIVAFLLHPALFRVACAVRFLLAVGITRIADVQDAMWVYILLVLLIQACCEVWFQINHAVFTNTPIRNPFMLLVEHIPDPYLEWLTECDYPGPTRKFDPERLDHRTLCTALQAFLTWVTLCVLQWLFPIVPAVAVQILFLVQLGYGLVAFAWAFAATHEAVHAHGGAYAHGGPYAPL